MLGKMIARWPGFILAAVVFAAANPPAAEPSGRESTDPAFFGDFGLTRAGAILPDVDVEQADGSRVSLHRLLGGRVAIIALVTTELSETAELEHIESLVHRHGNQRLAAIGLVMLAKASDRATWRASFHDRRSMTMVLDPAEPMLPAKVKYEDMTPEQRQARDEAESASLRKLIVSKWLGNGGFIPIPGYVVIDSRGRLIGWTATLTGSATDGIDKLLTRAGIELKGAPGG